ncbi:transmembrane protein 135-like isoform X2 [Tigriopus californicus]|uniref:transmembrane protein 135-like isoform X2 n=1 Tax=Tigriopus californicus TaxID=6832 RepID=UPI0027DAAACB|nr:transmembrane protein 135-like isoform X2 [Tigriopus californicus]
MGTKNSKLKPMYYTCHEIAHTWHPSCTWVALEIAESCFWEALKIYGAVYGVSTMLKGKIPSREQMRTLIWNTIQSSIFLSVNTGAYISVVCLLRRIIGSFNYYTLGWLGAVISSFLAILVERPSRRSLLAVYVSNVATESLLHSYVQDGTLPSIPHGEVLTFAGISAICMYLFKSKLKRNEIDPSKEKDKTNSNDHEDILLKLIRLLVGKSEQTYSRDEREPLMKYIGKIVLGFWSKREPRRGQSVCGHTEESCVVYGLKGSIVPFAIGQALQAGLFALPMIQGRSRNGLSTILSHISRPDVLLWSCFLGSFPAVYKLASCFLRNALGVDHRWNAIPAGFLAGLTMAFSPSRSMCLYSVWKTLEIDTNFWFWLLFHHSFHAMGSKKTSKNHY